MKFLLQFGAILIGSLILQFFLPWFIVAIVAMAAGYFLSTEKGWKNFLAGFLAILLLWMVGALVANFWGGSLIAGRFGRQMGLPMEGFSLPLLSGVIGGIAAGLGALTGGSLKEFFVKKEA